MLTSRLLGAVGIVAVVGGIVVALAAQAPAPPAFEVASVKESKTDGTGTGGRTDSPGRVTIDNIALHAIIEIAYQVRDDELVGVPDWTRTTRFNITATYPGAPATVPEADAMLQRLLQDRFALATHRETRAGLTYSLVLARADGRFGRGLVRTEQIDCAQWREAHPQGGAGGPSAVAPGGQRPQCTFTGGYRFLSGGTQTMADLASYLQGTVRSPVVDETGLAGTFNIDVAWTPSSELTPPSDLTATAPADGVSLFTALQEQLGLKLEPHRGSIDVLVIDHVERPTED